MGVSITGDPELVSALNTSRTIEEITDIVTMDKIRWAISTFKPFKSAGPDGIFPAMFQHTSTHGLLILKEIFVGCLREGHIPRLWREVKVIFIPKAGKSSHSKPKDYRPISLSSFLLKTLERLIDLYLRNSIETRVISSAQHAYLKGKSVESALHDVVSVVEKGLELKEYTLAAFLDIEGAFNNITTQAIKESLIHLNVKPYIVELIVTMLNSRIINSALGDYSIRKRTTRGTPQGGVLSPLLWLLAVNSILMRFDTQGRKIVAYADDVVILITGKFLPTISEVMQSALDELSTWAINNGLGVNPEKTELVLFTRRYKVEDFRLPKLNGIELRLSTEAKYLGIILDSKLTWKVNTYERMRKGLNAYYFCRNSVGKTWGLSPIVVYWIYTTIVRPVVTYGCTVWWEALKTDSYLRMLVKAQRCASLGITGAARSTPQAALDVMLGLSPIKYYIYGTAARSLLRLNETGLLKKLEGHAKVLKLMRLQELDSESVILSDYSVPKTIFINGPITVIPDRSNWTGRKTLFDGFSIFTDGSKMDIGIGSGVYLMEHNIRRSFRLPDECSVFQAEIFAIFEAAKLITEILEQGNEVTIYVDSQAAIKALQRHDVASKLVYYCKKILSDISPDFRLRICWVPGHCDIDGNEIADELARQGSALSLNQEVSSVKPPICYFFGVIRDWVREETNRAWRNTEGCRVSKAVWPSLDTSKSKVLLGLRKNNLKKCIGLLTGHCPVRARINMWDRSVSDMCRLCEDEEESETIEHILCRCPMLQSLRLKFLGSRFLDELYDIQLCKLASVVDFILGINMPI